MPPGLEQLPAYNALIWLGIASDLPNVAETGGFNTETLQFHA